MKALIFALFLPLGAQAADADLFRDLFAAPKRSGTERVSYRGSLYSTEGVQGTNAQLKLQKHALEASHVIDTDPTFFNLEARAELQEAETSAVFPESFHSLPRKLWNVGVGGNYRMQLDGDRTFSVGLNIGSESDHPFYSAREVSLTANLLYRFPAAHGHDQWLIIVNESNTRGFWPWIPLPGAGYLFDRGDDFKFFLGFPVLGFFWRPGGKWMVNGFYFPAASGRLEVSYFLFGPARIYAGWRSTQDVFLRAGRDDKRDRLFSQEKDFHLGIGMPLTSFLLADLSGRYVFKRDYYEGKGFSDRRTARRLDIEPSKSVDLKLNAAF